MKLKTRCLVTGHDAEGLSTVLSDRQLENGFSRPNRPGVTLTDIWKTYESPASIHETGLREEPFQLLPPRSGTAFRVIEFLPEDQGRLKELDGVAAFKEMGADSAVDINARHPFMHKTNTVDYAIVLKGEIYMLLDKEDHLLHAGDVVIQRGTNHAWSNRGEQPCLMAFVLIDGK